MPVLPLSAQSFAAAPACGLQAQLLTLQAFQSHHYASVPNSFHRQACAISRLPSGCRSAFAGSFEVSMKGLWIAAGMMICVALAGCASSTMKSYVGHNVADVALDYGPPVNAFDTPDGRRAFQWRLDFEHVPLPTYANSDAQVTRYGEMAWIKTRTPIYGGQPISGRCVYTLFGAWNATAQGWMIHEYRRPNYLCR
jgi:hypothetical protein